MILAGALVGLMAGGLIADNLIPADESVSAAGPNFSYRAQQEVAFDAPAETDELPAWAENLTASMGMHTEYVWRGISQSDKDFAVSGDVTYTDESGISAGVWASSLGSAAAGAGGVTEIDAWIGYTVEEVIPDLDVTGWIMQYLYAGADALNYVEIGADATFQDFITGTVAFSSDLAGSGESSVYIAGGVDHELNDDITATGGVGMFQSDAFADDSYMHFYIGASTTAGPWTVDLTLHGTDDPSDTFADAGDTRIVLGLTAGF
ncbi:MAG: hypothetical protein ACI841_001630 [Planctomycetota bacterium]|jgi:uncharacterized protein (TIGR02001 family)